ncbi:MAG: zinc ribbon domain-containing protein, partial [Candidatus Eremiobacterota bacterium]
HIRPGIISPEEFFYYLQRRIDEHESRTNKKITRLAFWDLTQIDYRFPMFLNNPMFLSTLVEFGKERNIAMCIMGAGNSKLTPSASAIADNVIFCWRDTLKRDSSLKEDHRKEVQNASTFLNPKLPEKEEEDEIFNLCPNCQTLNRLDMAFCQNCGVEFDLEEEAEEFVEEDISEPDREYEEVKPSEEISQSITADVKETFKKEDDRKNKKKKKKKKKKR